MREPPLCLSTTCDSTGRCEKLSVKLCYLERSILVAYELGYRHGRQQETSLRDEGDWAVIHDVRRIAGTWDTSPPNEETLKKLNVK